MPLLLLLHRHRTSIVALSFRLSPRAALLKEKSFILCVFYGRPHAVSQYNGMPYAKHVRRRHSTIPLMPRACPRVRAAVSSAVPLCPVLFVFVVVFAVVSRDQFSPVLNCSSPDPRAVTTRCMAACRTRDKSYLMRLGPQVRAHLRT